MELEIHKVCEVCLNLTYQPHPPKRMPDHPFLFWLQAHTVQLSEVKVSSCRGCAVCKFILQVIMHFELEEEESFSIHAFKAGSTLLGVSDHTIQVYTPIDRLGAWDGITKSSELSEYAHSYQAYQYIRSCLDRCLNLHPNCAQPEDHGPTRLIDVGLSLSDHVSLVETRPKSRNIYIALSYCWGDGDVIKTLTSNYAEMKKGILISTLPRTIQDAITVTRKLGQRYLWVDALCIIQDSTRDWEIESANMASIYRSSLLTLAAATATSACDGFLQQEHDAGRTKPPFKQTWYDKHRNETILAARIGPAWGTHTDEGDPNEDELPLSLRGWTLQERKLSTRMIMYRQQELWWSCLSETSCECHVINNFQDDWKKFAFNSTYSISDREDMYQEWNIIVADYSSRALKFSSDRLPAIAGIAKVVQNLTGSAYIAGLWKDNLFRDLTWRTVDGELGLQRSVTASLDYIGPTFSWVSVGTPVCYDRWSIWTTATSCQILAVESPASGLNPLGRVKYGYLTISAPLLDSVLFLRYGNNSFSPDRYYISCDGQEIDMGADVALETFERENQGGIVEKSVRRSHITDSRALSGTPILLLFLGHHTQNKAPKTKDTPITRIYLVLGKCAEDMARYERIGIARQDAHIHQDYSETPHLCDRFIVRVITIL